jgi:hypothetical protein
MSEKGQSGAVLWGVGLPTVHCFSIALCNLGRACFRLLFASGSPASACILQAPECRTHPTRAWVADVGQFRFANLGGNEVEQFDVEINFCKRCRRAAIDPYLTVIDRAKRVEHKTGAFKDGHLDNLHIY